MSGEISKVPVTLLSLLDMNSRGQAPRTLANETVATLDLLETYLQQGRVTIQAATNSITSSGWWLAATVPDYTAYWVHNFSIGTPANIAAGTTYRCRPAYTSDGQYYLGCGSTDQNFGAGYRPNVVADRCPRLLMPGAQLGVWCEIFSAGTATQWIVWADITPLRV